MKNWEKFPTLHESCALCCGKCVVRIDYQQKEVRQVANKTLQDLCFLYIPSYPRMLVYLSTISQLSRSYLPSRYVCVAHCHSLRLPAEFARSVVDADDDANNDDGDSVA